MLEVCNTGAANLGLMSRSLVQMATDPVCCRLPNIYSYVDSESMEEVSFCSLLADRKDTGHKNIPRLVPYSNFGIRPNLVCWEASGEYFLPVIVLTDPLMEVELGPV